jgi:hypothetical protein
MCLDRRRSPRRRKTLDEVARRYDVDAELSHELDRSRVDTRHVRNRAARRIFHRHAPHARDETLQSAFELIASGVSVGRPGEMRERVPFDRMNERAGLTLGGNQVKPPACQKVTAPAADPGDLDGDWIEPAEIVQQPRVDSLGPERRLNA